MHILFSVLGAAGAFAYYWYVLRGAGDIVANLADAAGRARGDYRRRRFRKKAEASTIQAITDPRTAAIVMAVAVASCEAGMTVDQDAALKQMMRDILAVDNPDEELTFAKWAVREVGDPNNVSVRLQRLWTSALNIEERQQLVDMVRKVAAAGSSLSHVQTEAIERLKARLDI